MPLWFLAVAYVWGIWSLKVAGVEPDGVVESIAIGTPLGLLIPVTLGFVLASTRSFTARSLWLLLITLTVLQLNTIRRLGKTIVEIRKTSLAVPFPILVTLPVALLNLVWAVAPEIHFDANNYHLAAPKIYLAAGGFINMPYFFTSYYARFAEMIFAFGLALSGMAAAKLFSFMFTLVAACCVFSLGKEAFDERIGAWAAGFFYSAPIVGWLSGTADVDNILAMFLAATALAVLKWYKAPLRTGWIYIGAALAGMTIAIKMNGAFGLPVLIGIICWNARRLSIRRVAAFLMLIAVVTLPWYVWSYHWTGNPVFPMLNGVFKSPLWEQDNRILNAGEFGIGTSSGSLARLPFRFVFNTDLFREVSPRGSAGVALLLAFPFSLMLVFHRGKASRVLLGVAAVYFLFWAYTFQYARYFVPVLPVVCILGIATVFYFDSMGRWSGWRKVVLGAALVMQFPPMPVQYWNIPERFPIGLAFGVETREHFLNRALIGYAAANYLNRVTKSSDRVIGVDVEQTRFYLNAPLETFAETTRYSKLRKVAGMPADGVLLESLLKDGFTYLFTTRPALKLHPAAYPYLQGEFLSRFADVQFMDDDVVVYRLHRPEPSSLTGS